ncbi:N-acetylmuramoyl-L-alanine amidase family protein [Flavobacterium sp. RHBU_3]|uniref:N-acetylmuramoyl-L-alanine amidase family protein n=1 Tax=Flavobacterium sp. RHBU_3 TaxID=3391184 RepID=UPI00398547A8
MKRNTELKQAFWLFIISCTVTFAQSGAKFRVVIDPGHGGKDFGAVYNGFVEKNIALNIALRAGKLLEADSFIDVTFTRSADEFVTQADRAAVANRSSADIFISIHCNAEAKKQAFGAETYVLGTTKNLNSAEIAKKENAVITLEKDFKDKYDGYNPAAPEVINGSLAQQEAVLSKSLDLASKLQEGFTNIKRKNRGVKQAPLWILNKVAMPAVFIEIGFLSSQDEGVYINSDAGQDELARAIAKAVTEYKKEYFNGSSQPVANTKPGIVAPEPARPNRVETPVPTAVAGNVMFKVQIASGGRDLELTPANFKGLDKISKDGATPSIKYYYGATSQYDEAKSLMEEAKAKGYTGAFVVAFRDGKKISIQEAINK